MSQRAVSAPITIRTNKVAEIDALASAMDRSRNYIVNQAIERYLEANTGRDEPIEGGASTAPVDRAAPIDKAMSSADRAAPHIDKAMPQVDRAAPRIDRAASPGDVFARLAAQHDWSG